MTFSIPAWVLWTIAIVIGVPLIAIIILLAVVGGVMLYALKDGIWR